MKTYITIGLVLFILFVLILLKEYFDYKRDIKRRIEFSKKAFGKFSDKSLSLDELEAVKKMFRRYCPLDSIDDITANDLSLDDIYEKLDVSVSAPGREYFYMLLRTPKGSISELEDFNKKVDLLEENIEECHNLRSFFLKIGRLFKVSFFDCLDLFDSVRPKNLIKEYISVLLVFVGVGLIFVDSTIGIIVLIATLVYNIIDYYKERGEIEPYIVTLSYIVNFLKVSKEMTKKADSVLYEEISELSSLYDSLKGLCSFSSLVVNKNKQTGAGNPLEILADYGRMLLHLDIIRFYHMLGMIKENKDKLEKMYVLLGKIEAYATVVSVRLLFPCHCKASKGEGLSIVNAYHPLVDNPVKNSISTQNGILITGSNASGKSTFLKTVAINYLFSKTIGIVLADSFISDDYILFSSMSLRDDLINKDSYFMVEIKALKRIFDYAAEAPNKKILCFVDEVLRGTNTVERIAACSQILSNFKESGVLCFAATHDIELTYLLEGIYDNYHFDEEIIDDDVIFNYMLKEGKATSQNAIKLLSVMGFKDEIVDKARFMAKDFINNGVWKI